MSSFFKKALKVGTSLATVGALLFGAVNSAQAGPGGGAGAGGGRGATSSRGGTGGTGSNSDGGSSGGGNSGDPRQNLVIISVNALMCDGSIHPSSEARSVWMTRSAANDLVDRYNAHGSVQAVQPDDGRINLSVDLERYAAQRNLTLGEAAQQINDEVTQGTVFEGGLRFNTSLANQFDCGTQQPQQTAPAATPSPVTGPAVPDATTPPPAQINNQRECNFYGGAFVIDPINGQRCVIPVSDSTLNPADVETVDLGTQLLAARASASSRG